METATNYPQPDNYSDNPLVAPHFSPTPSLTEIPWGHRYNTINTGSIVLRVRGECEALYTQHGLQRCPRHGLYWTGSKEDNEDRDRTITMVLVMEMMPQDLEKWRRIDGAVREILDRYGLFDPHGVCVRYYEYQTVVNVRRCTMRELGLLSESAIRRALETPASSNRETSPRPSFRPAERFRELHRVRLRAEEQNRQRQAERLAREFRRQSGRTTPPARTVAEEDILAQQLALQHPPVGLFETHRGYDGRLTSYRSQPSRRERLTAHLDQIAGSFHLPRPPSDANGFFIIPGSQEAVMRFEMYPEDSGESTAP